MAHKIRTDLFQRLRDLLEASGRSYAVYVSAANHETTQLSDAHLIFDELHEIFPSTLWFLGNLSDVGVYNYLRSSTFFATFFLGGVRANNGSVAAAMEKGAVVITNLDEHSPPEFVHLENLIDIGADDGAAARPGAARADQPARAGDGARARLGRSWSTGCARSLEDQVPVRVRADCELVRRRRALEQMRRAAPSPPGCAGRRVSEVRSSPSSSGRTPRGR